MDEHPYITRAKEALLDAVIVDEEMRANGVEVIDIIDRPFSQIIFFGVQTEKGERKFVAKKILHHPANIHLTVQKNQAVVEYEILSRLYPEFESVNHCNVPKPVLILPDDELYFMEYVDGSLLMDLFYGARFFSSKDMFDKLKQYYYHCGQWLNKFQEITGVRKADLGAFDLTISRCEQKLKIIHDIHDSRCPQNFSRHVLRMIKKQLSLVDADDIWVTGRHGDFGNWNILAAANEVTVFDFLGYQDDLFPMDFLKMLVNFDGQRSYLFYSNYRISALEMSFLKGYGSIDWIQKPVVNICEILHRVCSICSCVEKKPGNLIRKYESNSCIKSNLKKLYNLI